MALPELTSTMMSTSQYAMRPMRSFAASMRRETDSRKFMAPPRSRLERSRAFGLERHLRAALAEARRPARPLEGERVGVRRFEIREDELAVESRLDRAHRRDHGDAILRIGYALDRLATGDAGLEHLRVV